jgi:hypothetical protein
MRSLPPKLEGLLPRLAADLRGLYGGRFQGLLLYGSYARGNAREGSDVDLLLLLKGAVDPVREILFMEPVTWPLSLESGLLLSVMPVSLEAYRKGEGLFLSTVKEEAVPAAA